MHAGFVGNENCVRSRTTSLEGLGAGRPAEAVVRMNPIGTGGTCCSSLGFPILADRDANDLTGRTGECAAVERL
jgi:hypothetical protein